MRLPSPSILDLVRSVKAAKTAKFTVPRNLFNALFAGRWAYTTTVQVVTKDRRHLSGKVHYPKGHPKNKLTDHELKEKFLNATATLLEKEVSEKTPLQPPERNLESEQEI